MIAPASQDKLSSHHSDESTSGVAVLNSTLGPVALYYAKGHLTHLEQTTQTPGKVPAWVHAWWHQRGKPAVLPACALDELSPFTQAVLRAVSAIPAGETRSYAEVARAVGHPRAARAVGQALGANPLPLLIPCHRVVGSKAIGDFAWGQAAKIALLEAERRALA